MPPVAEAVRVTLVCEQVRVPLVKLAFVGTALMVMLPLTADIVRAVEVRTVNVKAPGTVGVTDTVTAEADRPDAVVWLVPLVIVSA